MKAKCTKCGRHWGISIYKRIPKTGYLCEICDPDEQEEKNKRIRQVLIEKGYLIPNEKGPQVRQHQMSQ